MWLLLQSILQGVPDWTQLTAVLLWLAGPLGAVIATNWIVANFLEKMAWWGKFPKTVKWLAPPIMSILIALGAQQVITIPGLADLIQPYWALVISIILGYFGSQLGHIQTRAATRPKSRG